MPPARNLHSPIARHATRPPLYVVAPYRAATPELVAWNRARALALGRLAVVTNHAPIVVHAAIGELHPAGPADEGPERAVGLACDLVLLRLVAASVQGHCWELFTDDGLRTDGTRAEWAVWLQMARVPARCGTWEDWRPHFEAVGLGPLWQSLRDPPAADRQPRGEQARHVPRDGGDVEGLVEDDAADLPDPGLAVDDPPLASSLLPDWFLRLAHVVAPGRWRRP